MVKHSSIVIMSAVTRSRKAKHLAETNNNARFGSEDKNSPAKSVTDKKAQAQILAIVDTAVMPKTRRKPVTSKLISDPFEQNNGIQSAGGKRTNPYSPSAPAQAAHGAARQTRRQAKLVNEANVELNGVNETADRTLSPPPSKTIQQNKKKKLETYSKANGDEQSGMPTIAKSGASVEMSEPTAASSPKIVNMGKQPPKLRQIRVSLTALKPLTDENGSNIGTNDRNKHKTNIGGPLLDSDNGNEGSIDSKRKRLEAIKSIRNANASPSASLANLSIDSVDSVDSFVSNTSSVLSTVSHSSVQLERKVVKIFETVTYVLKKEYFNVAKRMDLPHQPICLSKLKRCAEHHKKDYQIIHVEEDMATKLSILLRTDKPTIFVRVIGNMSLQRMFPNKDVILLLLEHILTINEPFDNEYNTQSVIQMAAFAYAKILENFPPCCAPCKNTYKEVIAEPIGDSKLPIDKFNPKLGLLSNLLNVLDYIIQQGRISDANMSLNESEDFADYFKWSAKTGQKYSFEQLSRVEKIERIFLVLNLLVQLMENDLTMWMLIYANEPSVALVEKRKLPLIAHFLWPDDEAGQINFRIKKILELFVNYVSIDFDPYKIGIVARLVNLIFRCVNLTEPSDQDGIRYPNVQNRTRTFCDALNKAIECNQLYSVKLYWNVLQQIRSPLMRLEISKKLINKLDNTSVELTPREIYDLIKSGQWSTLNEDAPEASQPFDTPSIFSQNFPCMEVKSRKASSSFSAKEYVELLQTAFEAYVNSYHLKELIDAYKAKNPRNGPMSFPRSGRTLSPKEATPVDYDAMDVELWDNPNAFDDCDNDDPIYTNDIIDNNLIPAIDISLSARDLEQYRADIKYYDLIKELIKGATNTYFKNWFKNDVIPNFD